MRCCPVRFAQHRREFFEGAAVLCEQRRLPALRVVKQLETLALMKRPCGPALICASSYKKHSGLDAGQRQQQRAEHVKAGGADGHGVAFLLQHGDHFR